jgi:hypothetical protein
MAGSRKPSGALTFVELRGFHADWEEFGLTDGDLQSLQRTVASDPLAGAVIKGTGGLRKLRFAPARWKTGKSGALRLCYVYYPDYSAVLLVAAYAKNRQETLSAAEAKAFREVIRRIDREFARRFGGKQ